MYTAWTQNRRVFSQHYPALMDHLKVPYNSVLQRTNIEESRYIQEWNGFYIILAIRFSLLVRLKEHMEISLCEDFFFMFPKIGDIYFFTKQKDKNK